MYDLTSVTRVEVIDEHGRSYTKYRVEDVVMQLQDDNRTLKLFIKVGATPVDLTNE